MENPCNLSLLSHCRSHLITWLHTHVIVSGSVSTPSDTPLSPSLHSYDRVRKPFKKLTLFLSISTPSSLSFSLLSPCVCSFGFQMGLGPLHHVCIWGPKSQPFCIHCGKFFGAYCVRIHLDKSSLDRVFFCRKKGPIQWHTGSKRSTWLQSHTPLGNENGGPHCSTKMRSGGMYLSPFRITHTHTQIFSR